MKINFSTRHPLIWSYCFFLYFSIVPQILIYSSGMAGTNGIRQSIIMSLLWLVPVLIWPQRIRPITAIIGVFLWVGSLATVGYWLVYGQEFSQSVIFIIFESNLAEGSEFISSYFKVSYLIWLVLFTAIPVGMWFTIRRPDLSPRYRYSLAAFFVFSVTWPLTHTSIINGGTWEAGKDHLLQRLEPAAPWNLVVGYANYREELAAIDENLANNSKIKPLNDLVEQDAQSPKTLVLVIGESTNRQRMSLYGYNRNTTPDLDALSKELLVFNHVVTPRPYTIEALQQVLSFADAQHPNDYLDQPMLLNMMKQAGYDITWITNQQTQTKRNTLLTTFSQLADHQVYLNNNRRQNSSQFDGDVLTPFAEALASPAKKKMIVVHLLGTHRKYDYRYPEKFDRFKTADKVPAWVDPSKLDEYNQYDNAVLYNDHIIAQLIKTLKKEDKQSLLVYFSDHGEEVFDYPERMFCGRNEANPSPAMYTIPFMVWANDAFKEKHDVDSWKSYEDRPYSSSDFIYTWSDMIGLDYRRMDYSRSLISDRFTEKTRWIGNPQVPKSLLAYGDVEKRFEMQKLSQD